jgi:hypothetical protein
VGVEEYGYVAPDPLNPNIVYGGKVTRFDRSTGQVQNVGPEALRSGKYRFLRTAPLVFSPVDPHRLFLGSNVLFQTVNGGQTWDVISPDLSRENPEVPESIGVFRSPELTRLPRRGVIYTVAPSYKDVHTIWAGTDDGLIHVTRDGGKTWNNVTPPGLTAWSKVSILEAGRFDPDTAYAAVNRIRLDDQRPFIYRTHDGGKSWTPIVRGLPQDPVNAVREDPGRKGLLFCGTERAVFVSFNDGDDWQSLRLNMPATSIRDLVVHNDDLVVGTHGRSFWILDDITPLRQITAEMASAAAFLFRPQVAYRVRWNVNTDTPLPPEEPAGQNPPDGAILNYYLKKAATSTVTLEIYDSARKLVRRFASTDKPASVAEKELVIANYWIRPPQPPRADAGMQRFVWDLHYPPPVDARRSYPMTAVYGDTPSTPQGPWVLPGEYTVKLTVDGQSQEQSLLVKMDPRVKTPVKGLELQFAIARQSWEGMSTAQAMLKQVRALRTQLKKLGEQAGKDGALAEALAALDKKAAALEGAGGQGRRGGAGRFAAAGGADSLTRLYFELNSLLTSVDKADATPTASVVAASKKVQQSLAAVLGRWDALKAQDLKAFNDLLQKAKLPVVDLGS